MQLFESYTELVEKLSIDEAFLDVTASARLFGDGAAMARRIKRAVREQEQLTVSVGVAPNKFLAKLASDLEKPDGLVVVEPGSEKDFLGPLPVERLWGVGRKTAERLRSLGMQTIGDIAAASPRLLERHLGQHHAQHLHGLARGADGRPVETGRERKQISREMTFESDTEDRDAVRRILLGLTEEVAARLRSRGIVGRTVTLKLRLAPFDTLTRRVTTEKPLFTTEAIYPVARKLLELADPGDRPIRLIGVGVSSLQEMPPERQLQLFSETDKQDAGAARVADVIDKITEKFGKGAVKRAKLIERDND